MTDKELWSKLNRFVKLGNELDKEAKRRYGPDGFLFHESEGGVHLMDGDEDGSCTERQKHVRESADAYAQWGAGAW
jgi:hypothetical protein